ncbi:sodium/proline symporter PutP [Microbacterium sp. gxy059]|uniref:sodium/proline symporter PutP n=1 Tax=Microbacterium sp. gxy059 TaxID=2957199 RepID=UPI003D979C1D
MSDQLLIYLALGVYLVAMIAIGYYGYRKTKGHEDDMLGGRSLPPFVAAMSAGVSDASGWLMMGLPGAIYAAGLVEGWIAVGLTIGSYLNWKLVAPRLRAYTEVAKNSITIPSFFENRLRDGSRLLRIASGIIILVFFTLYVSSGMVAGGVFFESSFDSDYLTGMLLIGGVTLLYTLFGGFLGASFTDVVQGLMMFFALIIVPVIAVVAVGGIGETTAIVEEVGPTHLSVVGGAFTAATAVAIISGLSWGLGYFGQPHIIVRFMALRSAREAKSARRVAVSWTAISMGGAIIAGLAGLAYMTGHGIDLADPETVMLVLSRTLLHPFVAGLILASVLAAIMSTISSQLIVCSSALIEDLYKVVRRTPPPEKQLVMLGRASVLVIGIIAMLLAISPNGSILGLVSFAWAGFGAAFGPIILLSLFWRRLTRWGALASMLVGTVAVFAWKPIDQALGLGLYEMVPAVALSMLVAVVVSIATYRRDEEIEREFTETGSIVLVPRG